jgi:sugar (pentulose or hexulose) kinase
MPTTLAFDLGASSGRCVIGRFERDLLELSELCRFPNEPVSVRGDLHWDLLRLWHEIKAGISRAAIGEEGASIGIDTWGVDFGLIDRAGRLLGNPYHYRDQRTDGMIARAEALVGRGFLFRTTGVHDQWVNTVYQLLAQQERDPAVLERAERLLFMPDLFHYFLTGVRANEYTIASTSQLLAAGRAEWSRAVLDGLGLPIHPFGRIVPPGTVLGPVEADVAAELGAQGELGVIAVGSHDTASAVASVPATGSSSWAFLSSGTWSILGVERDTRCLSAECHRLGCSTVGVIGVNTRLVKNLTGLWLVQECRRRWEREGESLGFAELSQAAREARPFVAHIDGDSPAFAAPGNLPQRIADSCAATGQPVPETRGELIRSILESIAFKYRLTLEELEALTGQRIEVVHVVGGGVSDELLCQFAANATGRPVLAGPVEATAIGNTIVQLMARGCIASLAEARRIVLGSFPPREYLPRDQEAWQRAYAAHLEVTQPGFRADLRRST